MVSLVVAIRTIRPYLSTLGVLIWVVYRTLQTFTSDKDVPRLSLLQLWQDLVLQVESNMMDVVTNNNAPISLLLNWFFLVSQDGMWMIMMTGVLRIIYCLYHFSYPEWKDILVDRVFQAAKNVPQVAKHLQEEQNKMKPGMKDSMKRNHTNVWTCLPEQGQLGVLQELTHASETEHVTWLSGKVSGTVYSDDAQHLKLMNDTYALYSVSNPLHAGMWPKINQCEAEVVAMTSTLLHGSGIGCTTSGGTESIMLAIKAHVVHYGKQRGIVHPELICGSTAHAAVDKACDVFGIRKVMLDCNNGRDYTLDPQQVEKYITSNTIMIYGSAPNYPQGTIDPIVQLGQLAQQYDIGLHVDACLGGFVLPFAVQLGYQYPQFDFQVPGVTSMSADTHKYGYATKGTSVLLYRDNALRHAQYFTYGQWSGGMYCTPTFAGSRPGALIGCAWASLVSIGQEGFQMRTKSIIEASAVIADGVSKIRGLQVMGEQRPSMVVCFQSDKQQLNIYRIGDAMSAKGWHLNSLQNPPSIHLCVTLNVVPHTKEFLRDLRQAVEDVEKEDPEESKKGSAGIYGMSVSIPEGPVNDLLRVWLDLFLEP
jgi:glutamate/tyrosine decarboxylase-like PLP-dependent enzyme